MPGAGVPALLRQLNLRSVLTEIRQQGPLSRTDLCSRTGLSRPTVNEVLSDLFERGWLVEDAVDDAGPARPGPRPRLIRFRPEIGSLIAIDVGAAKTLITVTDLAGEPRSMVRIRTKLTGPSEPFRCIEHGIDQALDKAGAERSDLHAAGLSTPGIVDPAAGTVSLAPQLRDWHGEAPGPRLADLLGCGVVVENEMRLAVIGERWRGAASGVDDVAYLGLGVGISAGLLMGGQVHHGFRGLAGEIGYLPFPEPSGARDDTQLGPLETAAGAGRLGSRARDAAAADPDGLLARLAGGKPEKVTEAILFEAARKADPAAQAIVAELVEPLAHAVAALMLTIDPELVVIGGGLSAGADLLLEPMHDRLTRLLPTDPPTMVASTLGDQAAVLGAVERAVDLADRNLLGTESSE